MLFNRVLIFIFGQQLILCEFGLTGIDDNERFAIEDFFEIFEGDVEKVANSTGQALQKPDVCDGSGQFNMTHPFTTDLALNNFNAALLAHHAAMLHPLVLTAVALVVFDWSKDLGAEKT